MSKTTEITITKPEQQDLYFAITNEAHLDNDQQWYHGNLDIVMPLLIIAVGLFQFILRKWIIPVSDEIISKLEDQFPTQGLIYNPQFGAVLMALGCILLILLNISKVF